MNGLGVFIVFAIVIVLGMVWIFRPAPPEPTVVELEADRERELVSDLGFEEPLVPADEAPAFKDETAPIPIVEAATVAARTIKRISKTCPVCRHDTNKELGCLAPISTGCGRLLKCNCTNAFHGVVIVAIRTRSKPKSRSTAKPKPKSKKKGASKKSSRKRNAPKR